MNIKRAMISLLALMMLPSMALAQEFPIPVTPAEGTAILIIQKVFADGNNETPVTLNLQCNNGQPNQSSVTVFPDDPFQPAGLFGQIEVGFVIDNIAIVGGEGATCTVTEEAIAGYDTDYICGFFADSDPAAHCLPDAADNPLVDPADANNLACEWSDILEGDVNRCLIVNEVIPVPISVTKVWDITNTGGDFFSRDVTVRIACNDEIVDYDDMRGRYYEKFFPLTEADFVADGEETVTAFVYPRFDREGEQRGREFTICWADEDIQDSSVEIESDCGSNPRDAMMTASVGQGDSCTITNTVFFEGIPTLSQYGMAIMALLMLGVGFVGFRRFV